MAIARDSHGTGTAASNTICDVSSFTLSSSNSLLLVGVVTPNTGADQLTGVTFDGTSLTRLATYGYQAWDTRRLWLYYGIGLSGSSKTIRASFSATQNSIGVVAQSYTGVSQTGFPDDSDGNGVTGAGTSATVTTTVDNCWVACVGSSTSHGTLNSGTVSTGANASEVGIYDHNAAVSPAGNQSLGWNGAGDGGGQNGIIIVSFAPVATASGPANVKTWNGLAKASVKTVNGLAIASVKTDRGLA